MSAPPSLERFLDDRSAPGTFFTRRDDGSVECFACAHRCRLKDGQRGICRVRFNRGGEFRVPHGYVAGLAADPVEKKPFYHVLPGRSALSFGMLGCDFHCDFCQNWVSSQALRDPASEGAGRAVRDIDAAGIVEAARRHDCPLVTSTYNEPLITAEWSAEIFALAKRAGLVTSFVSNGHATREVLKALRPVLDVFKVDLKCLRDETYRRVIGGKLSAVMDSIGQAHALGYWVEVVTLVVPGLNDSPKELRDMSSFIAGVSRDIPWHVTGFHPHYRMDDRSWTEPETLLRAHGIGREAGLRFVYTGNRPGSTGDTEDTFCPACGERLIERWGFKVVRNVMKDGACPKCAASIPGLWKQA